MDESPSPPRATSSSTRVLPLQPMTVGHTRYIPKLIFNRECLVDESQPENLEFTFVVKHDAGSNRTFYVNVQTRNRVWELPDVAALPSMPPLPPTMARGSSVFTLCRSADGEQVYAPKDLPIKLQPAHCWIPREDRVHRRHYYVNAKTNEKVMYLPPTADTIERVQLMYREYQLDALNEPSVEEQLVSWAGREQQLLADLVVRFGPEPLRPAMIEELVDAYIQRSVESGKSVDRQEVDLLVQQYSGNTRQLLDELAQRYGPAPLTNRQRILSMYLQYSPEKLHHAEDVMALHVGKLETLIPVLVQKWGPEPQSLAPTTPLDVSRSQDSAVPNLEQRVAAMFAKYDPGRLSTVATLLATSRGRDIELLEALVRRYGPEPTGASLSVSIPTSPPSGPISPRSVSQVTSNGSVSAMPTDSNVSSSDEASTAASDDSHRTRLVAFYKRYNPGKLSSVDETLRRYAGQEDFLMDQLVRKYGPEPGAPPKSMSSGNLLSPGRRETPSVSFIHASDGGLAPPPPPELSVALPQSITAASQVTSQEEEGNVTRDKIVQMYEAFAPDQVHTWQQTLSLYDGNEEAMLEALISTYGPLEGALERKSQATTATTTEANISRPTGTRKRGQSLVDQTRTRVSTILREHAPDMMTSVDQLLAQYAGREEELIKELEEEYCGRDTSADAALAEADANGEDHNTPVDQIRQRIAARARAESQAFMQKLDASLCPTASTASTDKEAPLPTVDSTSAVVPPPSVVVLSSDVSTVATINGSYPYQQHHHDASSSTADEGSAPSSRLVEVTPSILMSSHSSVAQLSMLERKLHEALDATERVMKRNEVLHQENVRLTETQRELQRQCDGEVRVVQEQMMKLHSEVSSMQHAFALERIQLKMQEESDVLKLKQETQEERSKFIEEHLRTLAERKHLEQLLFEQKSALATSENNISALEAKVKRREAELEDARAEIKFLTIQIDRTSDTDASTQTETSPSDTAQTSLERKMSVKLDLSRIQACRSLAEAVHAFMHLSEELELCKNRCGDLERELELVRAQKRNTDEECDNAMKFIHVLKNKKRHLEETVARLELRELALPTSPPGKAEGEYRRLEEEILSLQSQLSSSHTVNKKLSREISELRSLLSLHMAGSTKSNSSRVAKANTSSVSSATTPRVHRKV